MDRLAWSMVDRHISYFLLLPLRATSAHLHPQQLQPSAAAHQRHRRSAAAQAPAIIFPPPPDRHRPAEPELLPCPELPPPPEDDADQRLFLLHVQPQATSPATRISVKLPTTSHGCCSSTHQPVPSIQAQCRRCQLLAMTASFHGSHLTAKHRCSPPHAASHERRPPAPLPPPSQPSTARAVAGARHHQPKLRAAGAATMAAISPSLLPAAVPPSAASFPLAPLPRSRPRHLPLPKDAGICCP